jgi:hypothetical protein
MAFIAECNFCRLILRGVPDDRVGSSIECPRCHNSFTLAPVANPEAVLARVRRVVPSVAEAEGTAATVEGSAASAQGAAGEEPIPVKPPARPSRQVNTMPEEPPAPVPLAGFTNYPGLASFLLGCVAFLVGGVLHVGLLTLALGLLGLLIGLMGLLFLSLTRGRWPLPVAGLAVSLPAVLVPIFAPDWLGLTPLRERPTPAQHGEALVALNNIGGARRASEGETLWANASEDALLHEDVRLRIRSAVVGPVSFVPVGDQTPPADHCLVIGLRLTNAGITRKIAYTGWAVKDLTRDPPVLRDDQGKSYPVKTFPAGWVVKGRAQNTTLMPGKMLDDVLTFEAPPANIAYLRLELPAAAVGTEGQLRMEIPKKMIVFR